MSQDLSSTSMGCSEDMVQHVSPVAVAPASGLHGGKAEPSAPYAPYVMEALRGLTKTQKRFVMAGAMHGDFTMATLRALRDKALFYLHIDSPNGRYGTMRLTPLGETVRGILYARGLRKARASLGNTPAGEIAASRSLPGETVEGDVRPSNPSAELTGDVLNTKALEAGQ